MIACVIEKWADRLLIGSIIFLLFYMGEGYIISIGFYLCLKKLTYIITLQP